MEMVSELDAPPGDGAAPSGLSEAELRRRPDRSRLPARVVAARVSLPARLVEIIRSRELLFFLIRKELKVKYKNSFLGFVWSMLNPAIVLLVYYAVFTYFLKAAVPDFALYLFCGLLVWNFYTAAVMGSSRAIVGAAGIVKKVAFPREVLALAQVGSALVFFFFQTIVLVIFLVAFRYQPDWDYLPLLPFALFDLVVFASAVSLFVSAVNVYFRDVQHLIEVLLQAWFWGVPIIYSYNRVYQHAHWLGYFYLADPITPIVLSFQRAIYGRIFPPGYARSLGPVLANYPYHFYVAMLVCVLAASALLLLGSMVVFGRIEGNFAEEL